jgi:hypothetical protein
MGAEFLPVVERSGAFSPSSWFPGFESDREFLDRIYRIQKIAAK